MKQKLNSFIIKIKNQDPTMSEDLEDLYHGLSDEHYAKIQKAVEYASPAGGKGKPQDIVEALRLVNTVVREHFGKTNYECEECSQIFKTGLDMEEHDCPMFLTQSNEMMDIIKNLEVKLAKSEQDLIEERTWKKEYLNLWNSAEEKNQVLEQDLKVSTSALEFYANTENWLFNEIAITKDVEEIKYARGPAFESGGKIARVALKQIKKQG